MDSNEKELTLTPIAGKSRKAFMGTYPDGESICQNEYNSNISGAS